MNSSVNVPFTDNAGGMAAVTKVIGSLFCSRISTVRGLVIIAHARLPNYRTRL
jgi:hypothetical protein